MNIETLETKRLTLRKITPETYDFIYQNYSDQECMNFLGLSSLKQLKTEKEKYTKGLSTFDRTFLYFQLIHKETAKLIGICGFFRYYTTHRRAELGYALFQDEFKNKGYMSEAAIFTVEYGFKTMNLHRIEAMVGSDNQASLKLIKKLGFTWEGLLKQHYFRDGIFEDSEVFALIKS